MTEQEERLTINLITGDVICEVDHATSIHGPIHSAHEAAAIILKELDEFWDEVKKKVHDKEAMRKELIQVAAMAVRAIYDLEM